MNKIKKGNEYIKRLEQNKITKSKIRVLLTMLIDRFDLWTFQSSSLYVLGTTQSQPRHKKDNWFELGTTYFQTLNEP